MGGEGVEPPFTARYCLYALLNPCPHMCLPACLPAHLPACCRVPAGSGGPATACYSLPTSLPALLPTCLPAHLPACCTVPAGSGGSVLLPVRLVKGLHSGPVRGLALSYDYDSSTLISHSGSEEDTCIRIWQLTVRGGRCRTKCAWGEGRTV